MRGGRLRALVAATVASALLGAPAAYAQEDGNAASVVQVTAPSASELAGRISTINDQLVEMQARRTVLEQELAAAENTISQLGARKGAFEQSAAKLVVLAQRQAFLAYIRAEPASGPFAVAAAVSQGNVNDVAWSLGLLQVTHLQTMELARRAGVEKDGADGELIAALQTRDRITLELAKLVPNVQSTQTELQVAELDLDAFVLRLGPSTITGMTTTAYEAYRRAASTLAAEDPACGLRWELLAAIGKTESNHGAGRLDANGTALPPIVGIPIGRDTDRGVLDTDPAKDHAVGPMQFIPTTWAIFAADGNGDGVTDINNIVDATLAAGRYLCRAAGSLTLLSREGVVKAILAYNPSQEYLRVVGARFEALARDVANGWFSTADLPPAPVIIGNNPPPASGDGGGTDPTVTEPPAPPPVPTQVRTVTLAEGTGPAVAVSGETTGACRELSAALVGRSGFVRCVVPGPAVLDPCQVVPGDPFTAVCVADPEQPARLVRSATPIPVRGVSGGTPYFGLVLEGGDRCLPIGSASVPPLAAGAPGQSVRVRQQESSTTSLDPTTDPPTTPTDPPTTPTDPPTTPTDPPTTPTDPPTTPTDPPTTPTDPPTTPTDPPTTPDPSTTQPPTLAPAPPGGGGGYQCASGAVVQGQPVPGSTWTASVVQTGLAPRWVAVRTVFA
jgi:membrane-bound lytic murein transglycosylase B